MACVTKCLLVALGVILIVIIIGALTFQATVNRLQDRYKEGLIDSCVSLEQATYTQRITYPRQQGVYEYSLAQGLLETSFKTTQSNCFNIVPIDPPEGFTKQYRIQGINPWSNKSGMFAIIFTNDDESRVLIAFTGTMRMAEWMNDINVVQNPNSVLNGYVRGSLVHSGFYNVYLSVREEIVNRVSNYHNMKELYITGHSLGGALSTLCAYDLHSYRPVHYSFASPRVGNNMFAESYDNLVPQGLRVYNVEDTIVSLPPPIIFSFVYTHVNNGVPFNVNLGSVRDNHIQSYILYLPKTN